MAIERVRERERERKNAQVKLRVRNNFIVLLAKNECFSFSTLCQTRLERTTNNKFQNDFDL